MAATVNATVSPGLTANITNLLDSLGVASFPGTIRVPANSAPVSYASGTGALALSKYYTDSRTLAATTKTYDLTALDLTGTAYSANATDLTSTGVKILVITNQATTSSYNLTVFGAASTAFNGPLTGTTPKYTIGPGETLMLYTQGTGWTVSSSLKSLLIDAGSNSVPFVLALLG